MSLTVEILDYDQLTEEAQRRQPNNGAGKEYAEYLHIRHNGETVGLYSSAMEPEDVLFCRDLSWVVSAICEAYSLGLKDGSK